MAFSNYSAPQSLTVSQATYGLYSEIFQFAVNLNKAPAQVVLIDPDIDGISLEQRPIFKWYVPADPENNALHFQIQIDISTQFNSQPDNAAMFSYDSYVSTNGFDFTEPKAAGVGQASFQIPVELLNRQVYYWRVRAYDGTLNDMPGRNARYGVWSTTRKLTIGVVATQVLLEATRTYLPTQGQESYITASLVDRLGNVDSTYNGLLTFASTEPSIGGLNPRIAELLDGVARTTFTSSGAEGATYILIQDIMIQGSSVTLPSNDLMIASVVIDETPLLVFPKNGGRLPTQALPEFEWLTPANYSGGLLHFKIEIYKSPVINSSNLIYMRDSRHDTTGFRSLELEHPDLPVQPLSSNCVHKLQEALPDGKYWWRIIPWDTDEQRYNNASRTFAFSMPNEMIVVSKPLNSSKPITQAVVLANVTVDIGYENTPATVEHYITNMANEPELDENETYNPNKLQWLNVTEQVKNRTKIIFPRTNIPAHGWALAIKTVIKANQSTGRISFNGHGAVFDGDYQELVTEDYIGVLSALTPIGFQAVPTQDGASVNLTWAYVDLNTPHKRIIDKFIVEVYNPETGTYEPYDGIKGEIVA